MRAVLHDHQTRALESLRSSLMAGNRRPMLQAPTGAGKTILAAAIVDGALAKGKRVLFVVPFLSLIDQTLAAFAAQGITCTGAIQGYHPATDGTQPVQVASLQTLQRRRLPQADVVIVDEAHRWFRFMDEWMARPEWQKVPFIGLSATPWTKGLGKHYDDLVVAATTAELIEKGFLASFKVFAPAHPDLSAVKTVAGDYHEGQLSEAMSQPVLIADTVLTWLRLGENRPTLCFAVDRAHARRIADEFEAAGVPTGYVDAKTPRDERERIGNRLREGQIKVVCNVGCLTTGVDWDVRCIILARPTKSEMLYTQIIGRGLRTAEGKQDCLILDHSDTTLRLGFVSDIHHDTLDDGRHQQKSGSSRDKPTPLPKECPACSFLKPAGVHKCPSCGFAPERQSLIEEKTGSLVQLNGKKKGKQEVTAHGRQEFYSMLLWVQQERGYKATYAATKYKSRYGVWPRGLIERPAPPDAPFMGWLKSQQIAFYKRRQKEAAHAA
jgi:DNA repair protein RadD